MNINWYNSVRSYNEKSLDLKSYLLGEIEFGLFFKKLEEYKNKNNIKSIKNQDQNLFLSEFCQQRNIKHRLLSNTFKYFYRGKNPKYEPNEIIFNHKYIWRDIYDFEILSNNTERINFIENIFSMINDNRGDILLALKDIYLKDTNFMSDITKITDQELKNGSINADTYCEIKNYQQEKNSISIKLI